MAIPRWPRSEPYAHLRLVGWGADHNAHCYHDAIANGHAYANDHVYGGNPNPNSNGDAHRYTDPHTNASLYALIRLQCLP